MAIGREGLEIKSNESDFRCHKTRISFLLCPEAEVDANDTPATPISTIKSYSSSQPQPRPQPQSPSAQATRPSPRCPAQQPSTEAPALLSSDASNQSIDHHSSSSASSTKHNVFKIQQEAYLHHFFHCKQQQQQQPYDQQRPQGQHQGSITGIPSICPHCPRSSCELCTPYTVFPASAADLDPVLVAHDNCGDHEQGQGSANGNADIEDAARSKTLENSDQCSA